MANVSKGYGVGDTVYVAYPHPSSNYFSPQQRVVKQVDVNSATNEAVVFFEAGEKVQDGAVQTVYTTQVLCATAIINDIIVKADATVNIDTTTSLGSTVSQPTLSLGRVDA